MSEIWKDVVGFEGIYIISNSGAVISSYNRNGVKSLKGSVKKNGYLQYILVKDGKKYHSNAHRLVAKAFLENPKNFQQVNHKDGDKLNNNVDNLEWCNASHNSQHAIKNGLKNCWLKKVNQFTLDGIFIFQFNSIKEAAESVRTSPTNIRQNMIGKSKSAKGYIWKYSA